MNFEELALEAGYTEAQAAYIGRKLAGVASIEQIGRHINGRLAGEEIGVLVAKLAMAEKSLKTQVAVADEKVTIKKRPTRKKKEAK